MTDALVKLIINPNTPMPNSGRVGLTKMVKTCVVIAFVIYKAPVILEDFCSRW